MIIESTISAYQSILLKYVFEKPRTYGEEFAQKRFLKKMEAPDKDHRIERKAMTFESWLLFDQTLKVPSILPSNWYKARLLCHKALKDFKLGPVDFTNGSEFHSTFGQGSVEAKLSRSKWYCSYDNFDNWAELAYSHRAIKMAARKRFRRHVSRVLKTRDDVLIKIELRRFSHESYRMYKTEKNCAFLCFKRMLSFITFPTYGNRFSTVRKNNAIDRPVCLENICDMLVQRRIGNGIRKSLLDFFGVDLDTLAYKHRAKIVDLTKATIDLKNASDSIHTLLVKFMLPTHVYTCISECRSSMTFGLDDQWHVTNKISSMGNGFTFELMTLLLHCLGLQHDTEFSVFGDDIIVTTTSAKALISDLTAVGFIVNESKSFLTGDFRESCGGNYHAVEGYIESYDFEYPETIHDCIVIYNKCSRLSLKYRSFHKLRKLLTRPIPPVLQGTFCRETEHAEPGSYQDPDLTTYFKCNKPHKNLFTKAKDVANLKLFSDLIQVPMDDYSIFYGYTFRNEMASHQLLTVKTKYHWGKYFMYLHSGRRCNDVITGKGNWVPIVYVRLGKSVYRWKSIIAHIKQSRLPKKKKDIKAQTHRRLRGVSLLHRR